MKIPQISIALTSYTKGLEKSGNLVYQYSNFYNLLGPDGQLGELKIDNKTFGVNVNNPIDIEVQPSYDGSVNLILNDDFNKPKLINSRFIVEEDNKFSVADRVGDIDTNIYSKDNFEIEVGLVRVAQEIPTLALNSVESGGKLSVGSYSFYFKYADADGNETDFVAESGKVVCYVGNINEPQSIRGGLGFENSQKLVSFILSSIDLAFPYIKVYYTISTGDDQPISKAFVITEPYKVKGVTTKIVINGYEQVEEIPISDINSGFQTIDTAKTQAQTQNMLFMGNITNNYEAYAELQDLSLRIFPRLSSSETIGNLSPAYTESASDSLYTKCEYYNPHNIYYRLGYWDEEIYRLGIVYIMNDYSLSPVFNIRGIKELSEDSVFTTLPVKDPITWLPAKVKVNDDYSLESNPLENSKGVFRIQSSTEMFKDLRAIKPIGLGVTIPQEIIEDTLDASSSVVRQGLKTLTKGFFIVRQGRIPDIISQAVGIAKTKYGHLPAIKLSSNKYIVQSFLTPTGSKNLLSIGSYVELERESGEVETKAALCPEASVRKSILNNYFNSASYKLKSSKYQSNSVFERLAWSPPNGGYYQHMLRGLTKRSLIKQELVSKVTLVEPGVDLITNGSDYFSSKAGDPGVAYKAEDVKYGSVEDFTSGNDANDSKTLSESKYLIRGEFNTYLGLSEQVEDCGYYNIYQSSYDFEKFWRSYFKVRYDDSSPFSAISDRIAWKTIDTAETFVSPGLYRGDCYINTYTHRLNWNFIDPQLPTNTKILDKLAWHKNYHVITKYYKPLTTTEGIKDDNEGISLETVPSGDVVTAGHLVPSFNDGTSDMISYKRLVPLYTIHGSKILEPGDNKYNRYADRNGTFGCSKINSPDVNAVPLGHWATFKICSNVNLALRDIDFSRPEEEALHKRKRSFFPLDKGDRYSALPESCVINPGISKTGSDKIYFELPESQYVKTKFYNRIVYSDVHVTDLFRNGYQVFRRGNFQDYTMNYGAIVKLVDWFGSLVCVTEHGVFMIPVNERALMANAEGENVYINTNKVLPANPKILSETFGSIWKGSVIKTSQYIYGIDTSAKKIWRTNGAKFETISDMKIQKFLNDNIDLLESDKNSILGFRTIKSHYNANKQEIMFTFVNGLTEWSLCFNEILDKFTTRYTWIPGFSENINNIFYTFDNNMIKNCLYMLGVGPTTYGFSNKSDLLLLDGLPFLKGDRKSRIWKHGFAGIIDGQLPIYPTKWYGQQEKFSFEFVVIGVPGVQKIFDNLKIIANKVAPESFSYSIVGEGYDWVNSKSIVYGLNDVSNTHGSLDPVYLDYLAAHTEIQTLPDKYKTYLTLHPEIKKLPFIDLSKSFEDYVPDDMTLSDYLVNITNDYLTNEYLVQYKQRGLNIGNPKYGRIRGNMHYVEDSWDVQIKPLAFKYAYLSGEELRFSPLKEMKTRDKYIKIRIEYSGRELVLINAIKTLFTISYA